MAHDIKSDFEWLKNLHTALMHISEEDSLQGAISNLDSRKNKDSAFYAVDDILTELSHNYFSSMFSMYSSYFEDEDDKSKLFHRLRDDVHQAYAKFISDLKKYTDEYRSPIPSKIPQAKRMLTVMDGNLKEYLIPDLTELISMMYERYKDEESISLN